MKYLEVRKKDAEAKKAKMLKHNAFNKKGRALHSPSYVYFPIGISEARIKKLFRGMKIVSKKAKEEKRDATYRDKLKRILSKKEYEEATKGYDLLGNIAIIDVSQKLRKKERDIAELIMETHKQIGTVVAKAGPVSGKYRRREYRHVAGKKTFIAKYSENGCRFEFDIRKSFFSNRLSYERNRLAALVRSKETVIVMFAGIGPFAIEIAKAHPDSRVVAIELNKDAFVAMKKNIELNKVKNVVPLLGDVRKVALKYRKKADRIVMPLPKEGYKFLDSAFVAAKKNAIVHFYYFGGNESALNKAHDLIMANGITNKRQVRIISKRVVRPYSPKEIEIVEDFKIL